MRRYHKNKCSELIRTLEEAHGEIAKLIEKNELSNITDVLTGCQDSAIAIGNIIEASEGEGTEAVSRLEEYCELVYKVNQELTDGQESGQGNNARKTEKLLNKSIRDAQSLINSLPTTLEAVFLPYKASMWDSLESIWMAADKDPACEAHVIPIPYYDRNPDRSFGTFHLEKDSFPDYVPVERYESYNFKERHPDMIFIHNPYDEYNFVTSVHPFFYSKNLTDMTDCLVYVPYYATAGNMSEGQSLCAAYIYSDFVIVQSKNIVGMFDPQIPKEKLLPLGSPKFDRTIRICENPPEPPKDWKEKMEGKTVFFYNTSIAGMLGDTDRFLDKMRYVFDTFKNSDKACIFWRPHPLLRSTMESMRPELMQKYDELVDYYLKEDIGIYDTTPDIEQAIAFSDAFLGDAGTSVTALFGVAGKPMYILNNRLLKAPEENDWEVQVCKAFRGDRNDRYCITMGNKLFEDKEGDCHYRYVCDLSDEYSGGGYYSQALETAGKCVIFPANAQNILVMDPDDHSLHRIELKNELDRDGAFAWFFNYLMEEPDEWWGLPNRYPYMVKFDAKTENVSYIEDEAFTDEFSVLTDGQLRRNIAARLVLGNKKFKYGDGEPEVIDVPEIENRIPGIKMMGKRICCLNKEGTRLRVISLETGEAEERSLNWNALYTAILRDIDNMDVLWFLPYEGTVLGKWTLSEDKWETVDVHIEGLKSLKRPERIDDNVYYFSNGVFYNGKLILSPNWGNKFVELDTKTHEVKEWIPPFEYTTEDKNDYWLNWSVGYFYQDSWTLEYYYFYSPEHKTFKLDMDKGTFEEISVSFDRDEIFGMTQGFHKESQWMPYCCYEDVFNPLKDIVNGNIHGAPFDRERQIKAYRSINSSPDGDCGEKVYREMKKFLRK